MKSRVIILFLIFCGLFSLLIVRAFYLQMIPNATLERMKKNQYMTVVSLPPQRGKIIDRRGEELATSVASQSLFADPSHIESPRKVAKQLSKLLGISYQDLYEKLSQDSKRFTWLKRHIDTELALDIKGLEIKGLGFIEEGRRAYPNHQLLSQVIGFVGADGVGLEGLERKFDGELRGEKQSVLSRRDARGRPLLQSGRIFELSGDGATIETTIDRELQYQLERELEVVTKDQEAEKAVGIIMDPATGEVLAMGSYPSYDPHVPMSANSEVRRNRAVTDMIEPGSTFKLVTVAAALRTGRIQPNTKFFCENGKFKVGKYFIREATSSERFGWITLAEILEVSSNIGATKVAFDVGQTPFKDMMRSFGFGAKSGVDLLGEAQGLIQSGEWAAHLFSNISFGHGIAVTPLQIANAYSAVANGGKLMRPFIVKRVIDSEGRVIETKEPQVLNQTLTAQESATLTFMLTGVTEQGGTGALARVDGYPVAGKTGTAQKVNSQERGYIKGAYLSSFVGFVPANNPQYTIYIMVDTPKKNYMGAQVAAPVFNRLASFALRRKGFMPIVVNENSLTKSDFRKKEIAAPMVETVAENNGTQDSVMPNLSGLTVREVSAKLKELSNISKETKFFGNGVVQTQFPPAGSRLPKNQKLKVYFRPAG